MITIKKIIACSALCIIASTISLNAIDWNTQGADGNWNSPDSWDGGVIPSASEDANINITTNVAVFSAANVDNLVTGFNSTLTVNPGGLLTVDSNADVGNDGDTADSTLVVAGGTVDVGGILHFAKFGTRAGTVQLNSGNITVTSYVRIGGWDAGGTGVINISGGNFSASDQFHVGFTGEGTLNLSGGTLDLTGEWMNLRVGYGSGDGTLNMTGGTLVTNGITMDNNDEGNANINLDGGIIDVTDDLHVRYSLKKYCPRGQCSHLTDFKLPCY